MIFKKNNNLRQALICLTLLFGSLKTLANENLLVDGFDAGVVYLGAYNKCNSTKSIGLGNKAWIQLDTTSVISNPVLSIGQQNIPMNGAYNGWYAQLDVTSPPSNNYPTINQLSEQVKEFIASFSEATPEVQYIYDFSPFSELGGGDLALALSSEYGFEITEEEQQDESFTFGWLFDRIIEAQLPSVKKFKEIVSSANGYWHVDPLKFLNIDDESTIEAIVSFFNIKTTQDELVNIAQADVPAYAWVDKIQALEIPVTVSYTDASGNQAGQVTLTSSDALRYCEDGICQCFPEDISGIWRLRPKAGSMGVGRAQGHIGDWNATDFDWGTRMACLWDDEYVFRANSLNETHHGSFSQNMGDQTWLEPWQSPNGVEECGEPQAPFDGSTPDMSYELDIGRQTLTLSGYGSHIGLPRVTNHFENVGAIPQDVQTVYNVSHATSDLIVLDILSGGPSPWWHFELVKVASVEVAETSDVLPDTDLDGVPDINDAFPLDPNQAFDHDNDGIGNNNDDDDDNDGVEDNSDADPKNASNWADWNFHLISAGDNAVISNLGRTYITNDGTLDSTSASFEFMSVSHYYNEPFRFGAGFGATLSFDASIPAGQSDNSVRLTFEFEAEGDVPSCMYPDVLVSGNEMRSYQVDIPPQGEAVFNDILLHLQTPNIGIEIYNLRLNSSVTSDINPLTTGDEINFPEIQDCNAYPSVASPHISFNEWEVSTEFDEDGLIFYSQNHAFGSPYNFPEATAYDIYDGEVEVVFEGEVGNGLGIYELTVSATDSSGNRSFAPLRVEVIDYEPPRITLVGGSAIILEMGSDFNDPAATAVDNHDGEILFEGISISYKQLLPDGQQIDIEGISTDSLAEYEITYHAEDSSGNTASVTRMLIVAPPEGEIIDIIKDGAVGPNWDNGIQGYDQDLGWNSCTASWGCPNIDWGFVEDNERGSVLEITHADTSAGAGIFISSSDPIDIRNSEDHGFIRFDVKVLEGEKTITFAADCGYPCGGGDQHVEVLEENKWQTVIVPVKSLIPNGPNGSILDLENLRTGLVIRSRDQRATTFRIDNAYYDCRAAECAGIDVPFVPVDWAATHEDPANPADTTPTSYDGYTLVWSDEFDGDSVNTNNWKFDIGTGDNGNGELQYNRPDNASVEDGLLIIEAAKHDPQIIIDNQVHRYTSSKLKTEDLFEFQYGRVDIRAVVARGQGMWSAGWMLGANHSDIGWPYSGEIDIFDTIGGEKDGIPQEGMYVNNMYWNSTGNDPHTDGYSPGNININNFSAVRINNTNEGTTFSNTFHTFSLIWDKDKIEFLLDNETTHEIAIADGSVLADTFRNPFYLILNVAIGGAWPGAPYDTTEFPDGMLVDYVRVYQADFDGDGIADILQDDETSPNSNPNDTDDSILDAAPQQIVSVEGSPVGIIGQSVQIDVNYNTSNGDNTITGLGFRIHYDSDILNISSIYNVLEKDLIVDVTGPFQDAENYDNDSETDEYYSVGWASIYGDWPNDDLPQRLFSLDIDVNSAINIQQTNVALINFSPTASASGYTFSPANFNLELVASTWDFDGSCHIDALTDGLILLRYGFGLRGEILVKDVMHPNSTMTPDEVEAKIENAFSMIDIDMDGEFLALTDGLLFLRYLFDLRGQSLIRDVLSHTATRTSIEDINLHMERHMPNCAETNNDTGGNTVSDDGRMGPLDMTGAFGNGAVSGDSGELFINDTSLGLDFSGFALKWDDINPLIEAPLTFGSGGTLEFTASVPTGEPVDISFQLQKQASEAGLICEYGPVWDSPVTTISSATDQSFTLDIPSLGGDTFSNMIMSLSEDNIHVKITEVYITPSEKTDDEPTVPAECDGSLDMTGAYGDGAVSGEGDLAGKLFMNDTSLGIGYSGFANTTLTDLDGNDIYPFEFGSGGTLEFTASVPEEQSETSMDIKFQFQRQASSTGKFCDIAPIWEATRTVSGPVDETFTVNIPSQGGNTFSNLVMELSVDDVLVKVTGVKVTPSAKTSDEPTVPEECEASPLPSIYPENGINTAAMFNGTFGDEEGGLATIQDYDTYEFPTESASYGGWANGNETLYPITFSGGGFFAQKKIYFCASTTEAATVYFRFENEVYPANSEIYNTTQLQLTADGEMHAYSSDVPITYAAKSLLFLMLERETPITMGKVMGNWNGLPLQDITTDSDGDGVVDYCEDFPNLIPDWVDTDGDGASDAVDAYPDDKSKWEEDTP
jgi:beta-glucanase (GH16 family)